MKEADITNELRRYLEHHGMFVIKHSDKSTVGVPDMTVTFGGNTTWFEIKLVKLKKRKLELEPREIAFGEGGKLETMRRLSSLGRAVYLIFVNHRRDWWLLLMLPQTVLHHHQAQVPIALDQNPTGKNFQLVRNLMYTKGEVK